MKPSFLFGLGGFRNRIAKGRNSNLVCLGVFVFM
jgi:hypothetical protein